MMTLVRFTFERAAELESDLSRSLDALSTSQLRSNWVTTSEASSPMTIARRGHASLWHPSHRAVLRGDIGSGARWWRVDFAAVHSTHPALEGMLATMAG